MAIFSRFFFRRILPDCLFSRKPTKDEKKRKPSVRFLPLKLRLKRDIIFFYLLKKSNLVFKKIFNYLLPLLYSQGSIVPPSPPQKKKTLLHYKLQYEFYLFTSSFSLIYRSNYVSAVGQPKAGGYK